MRAATAAVVLGALLASGCGQSDDRAQVRTVATRFFDALQRHDGRLACAQLSQDTVTAIEQQEQGACATSVTKLQLAPAPLRRLELYAFNAKVDLANGASAFLDRTATGWRISAAGCRATNGDPREHPLSCEVQD